MPTPRKEYMREYRNGDSKSGWVEIENVQPVFDRLIAIYGTKAKVAAAMGIHKQGFLHPDKKLIQRSTLDRALELLKEHEQDGTTTTLPLLVVESAKLSEILRQWSVEWLAKHNPDHEHHKFGPTSVLAELSGYNARTISAFINDSRDYGEGWVDAFVADRLLTAIDLDYKLSNGELPAIANPRLTMEKWIERMEARGCI